MITKSKPFRSSLIWGIALLFGLFGAGPLRAQTTGAEGRVNYPATRKEISEFEAATNQLLGAAFGASTFAVVQRAKGAYLPGYGVTFSFLVNIHRAVLTTPFGTMVRRDADTPEQKKRRIEDFKNKLVALLQEGASLFTQLRKDESIAIVAFFEDENIPDEENQNKTIVLSILKKDADEVAGHEDRTREFRQRMRILEY